MFSRPFIALLLVAQFAMVIHVDAQTLVDPRSRNREHAGQASGMSIDEAVRMVESRYRARAVKVDEVNRDGRRIYEIRLLNAEGKVWKVRVDAETGQTS